MWPTQNMTSCVIDASVAAGLLVSHVSKAALYRPMASVRQTKSTLNEESEPSGRGNWAAVLGPAENGFLPKMTSG